MQGHILKIYAIVKEKRLRQWTPYGIQNSPKGKNIITSMKSSKQILKLLKWDIYCASISLCIILHIISQDALINV